MSSYVRPLIEAPVFRDADGAVINYGSRWHGSPPEDTYSVDTHPERFAPLHVVADALIAHLRETYDVEVDEGVEVAADLLRPAFHDVVCAVRIRPNDPKCASLTLVFTAYPGIYMHAGLLHDFHDRQRQLPRDDRTRTSPLGRLRLHLSRRRELREIPLPRSSCPAPQRRQAPPPRPSRRMESLAAPGPRLLINTA